MNAQKSSCRANSVSGFTLLEVILSIALLTTIIMLTINVLSSELFLRQKILERYPFDKIMSRIAHDISGAFIIPTNYLDKQMSFVHTRSFDSSNLFFTVMNHASLLADTKSSNIARIGYIVEKREDKNQLIRIIDTQMDEWNSIPQEGVGIRHVLVDDVKNFTLKFWKRDEFIDEWDSTSNEQGRLPKMVKIILTMYAPNTTKKGSGKKQELHLEEIVYIRNSSYKPQFVDKEPEEYTWQ